MGDISLSPIYLQLTFSLLSMLNQINELRRIVLMNSTLQSQFIYTSIVRSTHGGRNKVSNSPQREKTSRSTLCFETNLDGPGTKFPTQGGDSTEALIMIGGRY